ncbi:ABC-ATPase domain-containing protein [Fibrobacter sp. UWP2]|uniref:ABC-ATPase domain-containing protein n=1 Tax=Fibrobacter sp. UWP2 TaxID=1896216 RepID=UPI000914FDF1|nr:ABC-ATPase domain-containing protein [Fibrobacter sp. UWP2]SHJ17824.1 Predicted ATPase of the ABC class [Fibrobacter sp. UWP2]
MKALYQKIRTLNGKNYGLYKSLSEKEWDFGDFSLSFLHVQGDPFAPASRVMVKATLAQLGYTSEWSGSFERRLALSDFLLRRLSAAVCERYPEKDAAVVLAVPGPEMLVRNSLWIDNGEVRACLQVRLPGDGRKIQAEAAAEILTMVLPDLVSTLYNSSSQSEGGVCAELLKYYHVVAERSAILEVLKKRGLVAFVPDGAVLPRASGLSSKPLEGAVPFVTPAEMGITLSVNGREIRGMGIPAGVTVITGGAFHGKSTLLQALVSAVHPHVPGDGREGIVVDESAVRVGVEDGRSVRGTNISALVRDLPGGVSTKAFTSLSASGSTSEAANLMEAMEARCRTFFIDEDSSAVNFLIRDQRVRELLGDDHEPLIPLTDRIREMASAGCSFIIVAGACGDFLSIADNVITMVNYRAECVTAKARELFGNAAAKALDAQSLNLKPFAVPACRAMLDYIKPLQGGLRPASAVERQVKVKLNGDSLLQIGFLVSDTGRIATLVDKAQRLGAGLMLLNLCQTAIGNADAESLGESIASAVVTLYEKMRNVGFRNLPQGMSRDMSLPRPIDIMCALFRLGEQPRKW